MSVILFITPIGIMDSSVHYSEELPRRMYPDMCTYSKDNGKEL